MPAEKSGPGDLTWLVSRTCDGGACVKAARHGDRIVLGNTTHADVVSYTPIEFKAFLEGAKLGDFDQLI